MSGIENGLTLSLRQMNDKVNHPKSAHLLSAAEIILDRKMREDGCGVGRCEYYAHMCGIVEKCDSWGGKFDACALDGCMANLGW